MELDLEIQKRILIERCRVDINTFIEYVLGVKQHPFHRKLQNLANTHQHLCLDAPVEHGKSFQMSVARPLWLIGNNPYHTLAIVSNSIDHPIRCLELIRQHLMHNDRLHEVFPNLKLKQNTKTDVTIERGNTSLKDPTLLAVGIGGMIIGRRFSGLILDDIQDFDNTYTHEQRRKLWSILESTVLNRVLQEGFVIDIGTPWHVEDARAQLRNMEGYRYFRFDAMDGLWPETYKDPTTGHVYGFPPERLELKRKQMTSMEFDRQYRCVSSSGSLAVFRSEMFDKAKNMGRGLNLGRNVSPQLAVVSGVDLALTKRETGDKTVIVTGTVDGNIKEILDIRAGRWEINEIAKQILEVLRLYGAQHYGFRVENNACQGYVHQVLQNREMMKSLGATDREFENIRIYSHYTGPKKYDPMVGIRALAADFEHERVRLPCSEDGVPDRHISDLITGFLSWDPLAHTSDFVMAYWLWYEQIRRFIRVDEGEFSDLGVW